jgi:hypothetical protein
MSERFMVSEGQSTQGATGRQRAGHHIQGRHFLPLFGLLPPQLQGVPLLHSQPLYTLFPHTHSHIRLCPLVHTTLQREKHQAILLVASNTINKVGIVFLTFTWSKC